MRIATITAALVSLLASTLTAATIQIKNGGQLTGQTWADGSILILPKSGWLLCDKPIAWRGSLHIRGNGSTLIFRQWKDGAALLTTSDDRKLRVDDAKLHSSGFPGGKNRVMAINGRNVSLNRVLVGGGGDTIILRRGHLNWIGGGTNPDSIPEKYGAAYLGDVLSDDTGGTFYFENVAVKSGKGETGIRIVGASGKFVDCSFDSRTNRYRKESAQIRHGNDRDEPIEFINCRFINSLVCGPLRPSVTGNSASGKKYYRYAKEHPARIRFDGGTMAGYAACEGAVIVEFKSFDFAAKDSWNISPSYAVGAVVQRTSIATFTPVVSLKDCTKGGAWKLIAGSGVKVD